MKGKFEEFFPMLFGGNDGKAQASTTPGGAVAELSNYEESCLRWNYEVLIAEFKALREEIVSVKTQIERTYTYLFALIGAIAASRLLSEKTLGVVYAHHYVFILAALLTLWFPLNHLLMSADMVVAGAYIRDFIAPKLNNIARAMVERSGLQSAQWDRLQGWSDDMKGNLTPASIYDTLKKPMSWEEFAAQMRLKQMRRVWVFSPLYIARAILLYVPAMLLIYLFLETPYKALNKHHHYVDVSHAHGLGVFWENTEVTLFSAAVLLITILSLGAQISTSKLLLRGTRRDQPPSVRLMGWIKAKGAKGAASQGAPASSAGPSSSARPTT